MPLWSHGLVRHEVYLQEEVQHALKSRHRLLAAYANDLKLNKLPEFNKRDNSEAAVPDCPLEQPLGTIRKFRRKHRWPRLANFQKGSCNIYL